MGPKVLEKITAELNAALAGGVVSKIHQPDEKTLIIRIFAKGAEHRLLICTNPNLLRMHITKERFVNPRTPKRFCSLLRSRLLNARVVAVLQIEGERLVNIALERRVPEDDGGEGGAEGGGGGAGRGFGVKTYTLAVELTGKSGNVILVDSRGFVLDALKRFPSGSDRVVGPGVELMPLPPLPPGAVVKEVAFALGGFSSWNEAADAYYSSAKGADDSSHERTRIRRALRAVQKRLLKKQRNLYADRERALKDEGSASIGEILVSNMGSITRGMAEIEATDYTMLPPGVAVIKLDPALSPQENVQRYFRRAKKAKTALKLLKTRLPEVTSEVEYVDSLLYSLEEAAGPEDLEALADELASGGYMKRKERTAGAKRSTKVPAKAEPVRRYASTDGFLILCGKSGAGNDLIVKKLAVKDDIWFHASGVPGSHVLIKVAGRESEVTDKTIREAAGLAAYHSKARSAMKTEVSYTRSANVRKPRGAKPGMVTIRDYKSIKVKPKDLE
jgi:predicted ribosome quality control (RQC) complex YloA/Tae2 family protein